MPQPCGGETWGLLVGESRQHDADSRRGGGIAGALGAAEQVIGERSGLWVAQFAVDVGVEQTTELTVATHEPGTPVATTSFPSGGRTAECGCSP